jgi:hypothetical protein
MVDDSDGRLYIREEPYQPARVNLSAHLPSPIWDR